MEMKGEKQIIRNAWRKTGYEWFPKELDEITAAAVTNTEEDKEEVAAVLDASDLEQELPHYIF